MTLWQRTPTGLAHCALFALLLAVAADGRVNPAFAESFADFYKGKSLVFAIGTGVGGEYDLQTRLLARH